MRNCSGESFDGIHLHVGIRDYIRIAVEENEEVLAKKAQQASLYRLYCIVLSMKTSAAGKVLVELGDDCSEILEDIETLLEIPNLAEAGLSLRDKWKRESKPELCEEELFLRTKVEHDCFYNALIKGDFVRRYVNA